MVSNNRILALARVKSIFNEIGSFIVCWGDNFSEDELKNFYQAGVLLGEVVAKSLANEADK